MNCRTRSVPSLESFDSNWTLTTSNTQKAMYDNPRSDYLRRVPNGKKMVGKDAASENWTGRTMSRNVQDVQNSYQNIDDQRSRRGYTKNRIKGNNRRNHSQSADRHRTNETDSSGYISSKSQEHVRKPTLRKVVLYKSDGDFGFTLRQISSSMYGGNSESSFIPTARVPALQRLNLIDPGSVADRAGLRTGDYLLEVCDECVTSSPHHYVVRLIKSSANPLKLKVVQGLPDIHKIQHYPASVQSHNTGRYISSGDSTLSLTVSSGDSTLKSAAPRRNRVDTFDRRRREKMPQQMTSEIGVFEETEAPAAQTPPLYHTPTHLQTSAGKAKHCLPNAKCRAATVTNIRLSKVSDHDQVYYKSSLKKRAQDAASATPGPRLTSSGHQTLSSISSTGSSNSVEREKRQRKISERTGLLLQQTRSIEQDGEELDKMVNETGSTGTDLNHTNDRLRPLDAPFDTEEGYIRLGGNVDYVDQDSKEEVEVDFLEMAERVRQMYLQAKYSHQHPQ